MKSIKENSTSIAKYLTVIILIFTSVNFVQNDTFSEWDKDNDDKLTQSEFQEEFSKEYYSEWDINNDGNLSPDEFYASTFKIIDQDRNKEINTAEKDWGFEHLYGDYVNYEVTVEDGKDASAVDYDDYRDSVKDTEFYSDYDKDGNTNLDEPELSEVVFYSLDKNENGTLSREEFANFSRYHPDNKEDSKS